LLNNVELITRGVFMRCRIEELIESKGMKKKYVAKEIGITPNQLSNWLGMKAFPPIDKAYKLAKLLDCKVDDLYEWEKHGG
jgi:putative transcriptional regulator